jgi:GNAT superfamily N-acetyltransferase
MRWQPSNSEQIELDAWSDMILALSPEDRFRLGAGVESIGQAGRLLWCRSEKSLLFNRVLGLGPYDHGVATSVADRYAREGIAHYFVHVAPQSGRAGLGSRLEELGLERYHRDWVKLTRGRGPVPSAPTSLRVAQVGQEHAWQAARILAPCLDVDVEGQLLFASVVGRPHWTTFMAWDGRRPVSAGLLFLRGKFAYLAGGATLPSHRGQGGQSALVAARIRHALSMGCETIVSETGAKVPNEPNHSYRNMLRFGMKPAYARQNYSSRWTRWQKLERPVYGIMAHIDHGGRSGDLRREGGGPSGSFE